MSMEYTEYFSKWRKEWIKNTDRFGNEIPLTEWEAKEMKKYFYKLR